MSAARFTSEQKERILAAYLGGEKISSIAKRFKCDPSYPGLLAKRRGGTRRNPAKACRNRLISEAAR